MSGHQRPGAGAPNQRRRWVPLVAAGVVVVPVIEILLLIAIGNQIGALWLLLILLVIAVLGGLLIRREGGKAWAALRDLFRPGAAPSGELANAALLLLAGILLVIPGFLTDLAAVALLVPPTRRFIRNRISVVMGDPMDRIGFDPTTASGFMRGRGSVIPGEVVDEQPYGDDPYRSPQDPYRDRKDPGSGGIIEGEIER